MTIREGEDSSRHFSDSNSNAERKDCIKESQLPPSYNKEHIRKTEVPSRPSTTLALRHERLLDIILEIKSKF